MWHLDFSSVVARTSWRPLFLRIVATYKKLHKKKPVLPGLRATVHDSLYHLKRMPTVVACTFFRQAVDDFLIVLPQSSIVVNSTVERNTTQKQHLHAKNFVKQAEHCYNFDDVGTLSVWWKAKHSCEQHLQTHSFPTGVQLCTYVLCKGSDTGVGVNGHKYKNVWSTYGSAYTRKTLTFLQRTYTCAYLVRTYKWKRTQLHMPNRNIRAYYR